MNQFGQPRITRKADDGLPGLIEAGVSYISSLATPVDQIKRDVARGATGLILVHLWVNQLHTLIYTSIELYDYSRCEHTSSNTNKDTQSEQKTVDGKK
ncbi:hypothetical protein DPMN_069743 [Dreissena polymorpha]|uniref:Uncharacterized protein n=1 Tax=Dreissena polymorpha TaxID=45954 RepID=A0A9D4BV63_DREPO|nr:hypothetical protein DPMN_069743 [Dreissena polymorpha]